MGDVLDSLFSVLPIVLGILWLLRRSSRKAARRSRTAGDAPRKDRSGDASDRTTRTAREADPASPGSSTGGRKARIEKALSRLSEFAEGLQSGDSSARPPTEEDLYERMESRRIEVPSAAPPPVTLEESTQRTLESPEDAAMEPSADGRPAPSKPLDRIARLSPVAQGMVWSIILDEPEGAKGIQD